MISMGSFLCTLVNISDDMSNCVITVQVRTQCYRPGKMGGGGGEACDGCALALPTGSRGPLFIDQRLKQSDFKVLFYSNSLIF